MHLKYPLLLVKLALLVILGIISLIVLLVELFNNDDVVKSIVDVCVED